MKRYGKYIKEKKIQSKCMHRVVDDDSESPENIVLDRFDLFYICEVFCITLLTPHGGCHGACCVTSYGLHLSATPLLRAPYEVIEQIRAGSQEFADWLKFNQRWLP